MMSEWIKVSDEKPPVFEWFIGYGDDIEFILINESGEFFVWEGSRVPYFGSEITHWMPIPEVPND